MILKTEKVERRSITEIVSASGKIQPEVEVKISPDVSGEIVELLIKEGDGVKKGELLLKIKPDKIVYLISQPLVRESLIDPKQTFLSNNLGLIK